MKKVYLFLIAISIIAVACEDDDKGVVTNQPQSLCDSLDVLYTNDIKPLLDENGCSSDYCHGNGAAGYTIKDYESTKTTAEDPKFLRAIRHETGVSPMPKGRSMLSDDEIQMIECWIQTGMRE